MKNFSIFLRPEGRYGLTPFYDVLSAQPALDQKQMPRNKFKLAMSADFVCEIHESITAAMAMRLRVLESTFEKALASNQAYQGA